MSGFADLVGTGALPVALPVAVLAGVVSFVSPCVLPLVPGYLAYVTGLSGTDLAEQRRWRLVAGGALFVLGFSLVFVAYGWAFGGLGGWLVEYRDPITRVLGLVTIVFGLVFMGLIPGLQRTVKPGRSPAAGLAGAPLLGLLFGLGWTPCIGPTLSAIQTLAFSEASAGRGALLSFAYCVGLGLPFIVTALAYRRALGAFAVVKRHYQLVIRAGGGMLVVLGLLLVTGSWGALVASMQTWINGFEPVI